MPAPTTTQLEDSHDTIWYLAYGSNMDPKVFTGRRKVTPLESIPVIARDYWLSFDIAGIPFVEPCFASILKIDHARLHSRDYALEVHNRTKYGQEFLWDDKHPKSAYPPVLQGVAHRITQRDWQLVIQSDGGWGHDVPTGYNQIMIPCNVVGGSSKVLHAHVLEARPLSVRSHCQPTLRYKNLLTSGAAHHNLDPEYQRYLAKIVPYECNGVRSKMARALFITINVPVMLMFAVIVLRNRGKPVDQMKRPPYWAAWVFDRASRMSAAMHDYFIMPVFGSGRRSTEAHQAVVRKRIEERMRNKPDLAEQQACREKEEEAGGPRSVKAVQDVVESAAE
ncbi:hypothetical protein BGZ59_008436 [Podila verticillata]|nr:hypothetical protein BGZ59_008436 [Podila verticillata]